MRKSKQRLLLTWPGLPQLWLRGSWAGLALAVGFTVLVCVLLASSLVWRAWLPVPFQWAVLGVAVTAWVGSAIVAHTSGIFQPDIIEKLADKAVQQATNEEIPTYQAQTTPNRAAIRKQKRRKEQTALFQRAQEQYLHGDWIGTERTLGKILARNQKDVEARLMLATLCRHLERTEEATEHLDFIDRLEASEGWKREITQERKHLAEQSTKKEAIDSITEESADTPIETGLETANTENQGVISESYSETPDIVPFEPKTQTESSESDANIAKSTDKSPSVQENPIPGTTGRIDAA